MHICVGYVMLVLYQAYNHLVLGPVALGLGDHKPDIALMA